MITVTAAPSFNASTINIFLINIFQSTNDIIQIIENKTSIYRYSNFFTYQWYVYNGNIPLVCI